MSCRRNHRRLMLLAGGELSSRKAKRLRKHLQGCASCRSLLAELEADREWLASLAAGMSEESRASEVGRRALEAWRRERESSWSQATEASSSRRSWGPLRAALGAAAFLLIIFVGSWILLTAKPPAVRLGDRAQATRETVRAYPRWTERGEGGGRGSLAGSEVAAAQVEVPPVNSRKAQEVFPGSSRASAAADNEAHLTKFTVKLETGDPGVVIYWVVETKKGATSS